VWTYRQSTGELSCDGAVVAKGYSGHVPCRNDPTKQDVAMYGPIPRGRYTIGDPFESQLHGPATMRLQPSAGNKMFGRAGFLIHGDSLRLPGWASEGCIVLGRTVRLAMARSSDRELTVIE
jgi:hypothetical protein